MVTWHGRTGPTDHIDNVPSPAEVEELLGVGWAAVHAAVRHVGVALRTHRPRRGVYVFAAVGNMHVPIDRLVVATGRVDRDAHTRGDHLYLALAVEHDVGAVHRGVLGPTGADRVGGHELSVVGYCHLVRGQVGGRDPCIPNGERDAVGALPPLASPGVPTP